MPDPAPDSPLTRARARLAIEHALRSERARRADLEARLARAEQEAAKQRQALTAERDALNTRLSREQRAGAEISNQLDTAKAQIRALDAELGSVRRELLDAKADGDHNFASLKYEREILASLRRNTESNTEQLVGRINSLYQELHQERDARLAERQRAEEEAGRLRARIDGLNQVLLEAKSANPQRAPRHGAWTSRQENAEEHTPKKKLKRELAEALSQLDSKQIQFASVVRDYNQIYDQLAACRSEQERLKSELAECRQALEIQKAATRKVATSVMEARLRGTGVSYTGALDGSYKSRLDSLALSKQDELLASADLARWQVINGKRQTARELDPNKTLEEQAVEAAIAARWALLSNPPKALRWRPAWAMWGFVLDEQSEKYLLDQSAEALWDMTLAVPKKERRLGRL